MRVRLSFSTHLPPPITQTRKQGSTNQNRSVQNQVGPGPNIFRKSRVSSDRDQNLYEILDRTGPGPTKFRKSRTSLAVRGSLHGNITRVKCIFDFYFNEVSEKDQNQGCPDDSDLKCSIRLCKMVMGRGGRILSGQSWNARIGTLPKNSF